MGSDGGEERELKEGMAREGSGELKFRVKVSARVKKLGKIGELFGRERLAMAVVDGGTVAV